MRAVYSVPELGLGDGLLKKFVAANLSFFLEDRGISREQFAEEVGVQLSSVSRWLNGKQLPKEQYWPKILKALAVQMTDLTQDPSFPRREIPLLPSTPRVPKKDLAPVIRYLRQQANEMGFDLVKLPEKRPD